MDSSRGSSLAPSLPGPLRGFLPGLQKFRDHMQESRAVSMITLLPSSFLLFSIFFLSLSLSLSLSSLSHLFSPLSLSLSLSLSD